MSQDRKPHVHAAIIKKWADGAEVQFRDTERDAWSDASTPNWTPGTQYRIKPAPKYKAGDLVIVTGVTTEEAPDGTRLSNWTAFPLDAVVRISRAVPRDDGTVAYYCQGMSDGVVIGQTLKEGQIKPLNF